MTETMAKSFKRGEVVIMFNGQSTPLGNVLVDGAKRMAHQMVRRCLLKESKTKKEATAKVMVYDACVDEVHGFRKCDLGAITITHTDGPKSVKQRMQL